MVTQPPDWLYEYEDQLDNGNTARLEYDREGDVLEIIFAKGSARGFELTDGIILRYDPQNAKPLSLIFLTFSHLMQPAESGLESFRLTRLDKLPQRERDRVMHILTSLPVNRYLTVSALSLVPNYGHLEPVLNRHPRLPVVP